MANAHTPPPQDASLAAAFEAACGALSPGGIGTLQERTLHSTLKFWLQPDATQHEVPVGHHVADIFDGVGVTEVQTGSLYPLQKKLDALLATHPVTVVMPLPHYQWVFWIDPETGVAGPPHRSPRSGRVAEALPELFWLRDRWARYPDRLTVRVLVLDMEEYRLQDGWGNGGKRGSHRADRRPLAVADDITLTAPAEAVSLLSSLPSPFTTRDFQKVLGHRGRAMTRALRFLEHTGVIVRCGKQGNAIVYSLAKNYP